MHADKETITAISLLIPFVGMALGGFIINLLSRQAREEREMLNRERLAAIEKGLDVPLFDVREPKNRTSPLHSALVTLATGIGISVPVLGYGPGAWMWGFWVALVALAMLAHWFMGGKREWEQERMLGDELRRAYIVRLRGFGRTSGSDASDGN